MKPHPIRVVVAKIGLDGHDRGVRIVAQVLRNAGMEVIYTGLWVTPQQVARAVADEDADALGISLLSGAHLTLVPQVLEALMQEGLGHVPVILGGIIPDRDIPPLTAGGVAKVLGPGASLKQIVDAFEQAAEARGVR